MAIRLPERGIIDGELLKAEVMPLDSYYAAFRLLSRPEQ